MDWLDKLWREAISPEPTLTVSEWADRHRILPATSAELVSYSSSLLGNIPKEN